MAASSSSDPAQQVKDALLQYDEAVQKLANRIKQITDDTVDVLDKLYAHFDNQEQALPDQYKWTYADGKPNSERSTRQAALAVTPSSGAGGAVVERKKKDKKHKKRHGGDDISNTGTLISSVSPPANYASDSYLSVLQNTPDSTASTMTISNNPAYILPGGDSAYLDRPLHGGKKRT